MADNKLNLLFQFTGVDKVSDNIKNIIGASKGGADAIRNMQKEVRSMEKDLAKIHRTMSTGGSQNGGLIMAERELKTAIADTNREIEIQQRRLQRVETIRTRAGKTAEIAGKAGAAASAAVTLPLVAFGRAAFQAAVDAGELESAFGVTFGKQADMMNAWAEKTGNALDRTKVEMMESANTFGIFFNMADPSKSAAMSQQFAVLAQDLSSFYNVDPGTALEKLRSGLTGESEPLRDFGVFMTDAAVKAQALKMGLKPVGKEFSEQQKIMARASLIMESTKNAQGDLIRTSDQTANRMRAADTAWQNMSLTIGTELIPALTPAIKTFTDVVKSFSALSPETRRWIVIGGAVAAVIGPILVGFAGVAGAIGTLAPIIGGLVTGFGIVASVIGTVVAAVGAVPILIGLAVIAIGAAAYAIYAHFGSIQGAITGSIAWLKGAFNALPGWMKSIGSMMMQGLLMSLNPALLVTRLISIAKSGVTAFKNYFGIKSPSRLFMEMGGHINEGLGIGLERGQGRPVRAVGRMASAVAGAGATPFAPAAAAARAAQQPAKVENHFHITQKPGEDSEAFARRVAKLVEEGQRQNGRREYGDDF
ncbi:hypothetical protein ACLIMP_04290 [Novosphingobium aerophilum]|uniref:hypothetical protein n=1 Tax=Novosphingobium aerophilum TaxID=2839843 RepID=UPI003FD22223